MAEDTVTTNEDISNVQGMQEAVKRALKTGRKLCKRCGGPRETTIMLEELDRLRYETRFLKLLAEERMIRAKRIGVQAAHYEKLYKIEKFKEVQRKAQLEKAKQEATKAASLTEEAPEGAA